MSVLTALTDALAAGTVEVVDLTARLTSQTPVIITTKPSEISQIGKFAGAFQRGTARSTLGRTPMISRVNTVAARTAKS